MTKLKLPNPLSTFDADVEALTVGGVLAIPGWLPFPNAQAEIYSEKLAPKKFEFRKAACGRETWVRVA